MVLKKRGEISALIIGDPRHENEATVVRVWETSRARFSEGRRRTLGNPCTRVVVESQQHRTMDTSGTNWWLFVPLKVAEGSHSDVSFDWSGQ